MVCALAKELTAEQHRSEKIQLQGASQQQGDQHRQKNQRFPRNSLAAAECLASCQTGGFAPLKKDGHDHANADAKR
jgi:hypothetical protein